MDPVQALRQLGGQGTYRELLGQQVTRASLARAVTEGRVHRPRRNAYCLVDLDADRRLAVELRGAVSPLSAAVAHGWKVKREPLRPTVTLPRNARRPVNRDLEVRWADLSDADVHRRLTSRARTVVDCARSYDLDVALSVADSALREGVVDRDDLLLAAAASPRTGRQRAVRVAGLASPLRANPFESCLFTICLGIPGLDVVPQGRVPGVGYVDLLDRRLGLVIEAESLAHHASRGELRRDASRYTRCATLGLVVLRFTWEQVMFEAVDVREAVRDAVLWRTRQAVGVHGLAG